MSSPDVRTLLKNAILRIDDLEQKLASQEAAGTAPIAVLGVGCRFPAGGNGPGDFFAALERGADGVRRIGPDRWPAEALPADRLGVRWAGLLDSVDRFDAQFFGISPREATRLDPQQRLLLEVTWEALEHAGQRIDRLFGSQTGVFIGMMSADYGQIVRDAGDYDMYSGIGNAHSTAAGRIAYTLGLHGPCLTVDTACSSSLVATHLACQSLRQKESDLAIVAGVNVIVDPTGMAMLIETQAISPDGRCKTFDASANGFVRGEGCGVVILKRLSDAERDGDPIVAVIRGSVVNQDGRSTGMTAPNVVSQQAMLRRALKVTRLRPEDIGYVETHGTGTSLGDPIEFEALREVLGKPRADGSTCVLGALKTNVGHMEGAAGIGGLIKAVLCLQHEAIPRNLHFKTLNPRMSLEGTPFVIPTETIPWKSNGKPRRAGVSSFGISGTNAHVILEEAPIREEKPFHATSTYLLPLSAKTPEALAAMAKSYQEWFATTDAPLHHVAYTASLRRSHLEHRLSVVGSTKEDIAAALGAFAAGEMPPGVVAGKTAQSAPKVVFVFPGQGSQWVGMGRQLYREEPAFRDALAACDEAIRKEAGFSVIEELEKPEETSRIHETIVAQPALFAVEVALAALLQSWGVVPSAVIGHSVGEIAAAHVAGMLDLALAARLVSVRARIMQKATGHGKMVSVALTKENALKAIAGLENRVGIAAVNDFSSVVLSGDIETIDSLVDKLAQGDVQTRPLRVNYAFHSPQMEPLLADFKDALGDFAGKPGNIAMFSTVTGKPIADKPIDATYWAQNIRQTVRFAEAIASQSSNEHCVFVEVGPHPVLALSMEQTLTAKNIEGKVLSTLRRDKDERKNALMTLGALHTLGVAVDWKRLYPEGGKVVELPTYPWQRKRHWIETTSQTLSVGVPTGHPLLGNALAFAGLEATFESTLNPQSLTWLNDHRVFGAVVVPGTALLEIARAAGAKHLETEVCQVLGFTIQAPLRIGQNERRRVQVLLEKINNEIQVRIHSQSQGSSNHPLWVLHAQGTVRASNGSTSPNIDLAALRAREHTTLNVADIYAAFARNGLDYGPDFQGLREVRRMGTEALSYVALSDAAKQDVSKYGAHPALLDAGLQSLIATWQGSDETTYLPLEFGEVTFYGAAPEHAWVHAVWLDGAANAESVTASVSWMDETGRVFASLSNFRAKRANAETLRRTLSTDTPTEQLYRVEWQPRSLPEGLSWPSGTWILVGDSSTATEQIEARFASQTLPCQRMRYADASQQISEMVASGTTIAGIICLGDEVTGDSLAQRAEAVTGRALQFVQSLVRTGLSTRLFFVTHRAVGEPAGESVSMAQSPLWGFGRVVRSEHPELGCKLVDVDDFYDESWWSELASSDDEPEVAWRNGKRFVARLVKSISSRSLRIPDGDAHALAISKKGELSNLYLESIRRRAPEAGEIEIEVHASGLNFRDVLNALGMYPGEAGALGSECAGVVVAVGSGVNGFVVGDCVMALALGAFRSFATVDARLVACIPHGLSMAQAAAIPIVFLTAWYALHDLGHLQAGERILIHAAAGGVGMAAVQIAKRIGAEVLATASLSKWSVVRNMGVEHIANSRNVEFKQHFGKVDVVLNSLAGEFVDASLSLLSPGGRFLEMGKTDIRSTESIDAAYPGQTYRAFDLMEAGPDRIREMFQALVNGFATGELVPLPIRGFALTNAEFAFRYMAQAQHIGKIVLRALPRRTIATNATVLVTGGLGALGLHVARWLWEKHRVSHIMLVGRSAPTPEKLVEIERLRSDGAQVTISSVDVANVSSVRELVASIPAHRPLRGIIHAAGVLDDGMISEQNEQRYSRVFAPKVHGAWNLHEATRHLPIDFFVMFSSIASVLGSPGQSNYAAANAFLNALVHTRRAEGLPGQSLQWGAWAEGGMAAALSETLQSRFSRLGMGMLSPAQGLSLLENALAGEDAEWVATLLDTRALEREFGADLPPLWRGLLAQKNTLPNKAIGAKGVWREHLSRLTGQARDAAVSAGICEDIAKVLSFGSANDVPNDRPLQELGLDSLMAVELRNAISARVSARLPATLLFDYPSVKALRQYLLDKVLVFEAPATALARPVKAAASNQDPIAIIGMGCRFPGGVRDPEGFWRLLEDELDAIREVPKERWDIDAFYDPNPDAPGKMTTRWGGFLDEIDRFEPGFFGVSPREARNLDPQQRLLLETTWEALERAGIPADSLMGSDTGVYVGICGSDYQQRTIANIQEIDPYSILGTAHSAIVGRISYWLGLQGPNMAVDTACSSSLVSLHLACKAIRAGECQLAIAGGVNVVLSPDGTVYFSRLKAMSPTGRCHTFSADADGYVRSEGCGMVVLKRLSDALHDGDSIVAVIRGTAVNQDGRSQGLTAPNGPAQETVIRKALLDASVRPIDVDYVEAHGTGTPLGDPIEVQALAGALGEGRNPDNPLLIGSVKTNIGHTEGAAGIAGLLKAALSLKHGKVPRSLHFVDANPHVAWSELPVKVATQAIPWVRNGKARIAGVSSFGFSGTNAHMILEEAPIREEKPFREASSYLLPLSAKTPEALVAMAKSYQEWFATTDAPLHHVAYTASLRRSHLEHRLGVIGTTKEAIATALGAFAAGEMPPGVVTGKAAQTAPKVVFVFPGQGSQWVGMGRQLYREEPVFRNALSACDEAIRKETGFSVIAELDKPEETSRIHETIVAQPALFAVEVALAALLQSWGVVPSAVIGHSVGEIAAAHVAGMLDLALAARLVSVRARIMQKATGHGKMVSVALTKENALKAIAGLENRVGIAAVNDFSSVVLSGDIETIDSLVDKLAQGDVQTRPLRVNYAFHSPQMEPLLADFKDALGDFAGKPGNIAMFSTVTGKPIADKPIDATYWAQNIRQTVRFAEAIASQSSNEHCVFVEVGPHPVLALSMEQTLTAKNIEGKVLSTLRRDKDERKNALMTLGALHTLGVAVDWKRLYPEGGKVVELPTYPWQRKRYWIETQPADAANKRTHDRSTTSNKTLLGRSFSVGALPNTRFWESEFRLDQPFPLSERKNQNKSTVSWSAQIEFVLEAARTAFGDACAVDTFSVLDEPTMDDQARVTLQVALNQADTLASFSLGGAFQTHDDGVDAPWHEMSLGRVRKANTDESNHLRIEPLATIRARASEMPFERLYASLARRGLAYGSGLRVVRQAWALPGEALGRLVVPAELRETHARVGFVWGLLEGCMQLVHIALSSNVPPSQAFRVKEFRNASFLQSLPPQAWAYIRLQSTDPTGLLRASFVLLDDAEHVVMYIDDVELEAVVSNVLPDDLDDPTTVRRIIRRIVQQVSALQDADMDANQTLLGAGVDSLMFVQILRQTEQAFGVTISSRTMQRFGISLAMSTLQGLSDFIMRVRRAASADPGHGVSDIDAPSREAEDATTPITVVNMEREAFVPESYRTLFGPDLPIETWMVSLSNGETIEVLCAGAGEPLVLLPPIMASIPIWVFQIIEFSHTRRVIVPNYPGYGRSTAPLLSLPPIALARRIHALLDAFGLDTPVDIVGWSLGGLLMQEFALTWPHRLRSLSLVNTTSHLEEEDSVKNMESAFQRLAVDLETSPHGEEAATTERRKLAQMASQTEAGLQRSLQYSTEILRFDASTRIHAIQVPTLIVQGLQDTLAVPRYGRHIAESIAGSTYHEFAEGGHFVPLHHPAAFNAVLRDFLSRQKS